MGDDFSDPDPADPAPEIPDLNSMVEGSPEGEALMIDTGASCLKCSHFDVCAVYSGIRPMMQDWHTEDAPGAEPPIDVERLAWICDEYDPDPD